MTTGKELAELPFDEAFQKFGRIVRSRFPFEDPDISVEQFHGGTYVPGGESIGRSLIACRLAACILSKGEGIRFCWFLSVDLDDELGGYRFYVGIMEIPCPLTQIRAFKELEDALCFMECLGLSLTKTGYPSIVRSAD